MKRYRLTRIGAYWRLLDSETWGEIYEDGAEFVLARDAEEADAALVALRHALRVALNLDAKADSEEIVLAARAAHSCATAIDRELEIYDATPGPPSSAALTGARVRLVAAVKEALDAFRAKGGGG